MPARTFMTSPSLLAAALLAACGAGSPPLVPDPPVRGFALDISEDALSLRLLRDGETLLTFAADAFELAVVGRLDPERSYDPYWFETDDPLLSTDPPRRWARLESAVVVERDPASVVIAQTYSEDVTATLTLREVAPGRFAARLVPESAAEIAYIRLRAQVDPAEGFYGLGEWGDTVDHRGQLRPMQIEADLGIESANNENHVPVPLLIGTRGWGLFVESRRPGVFDVARKATDRVEATFGTAWDSAAGLLFHIFAAAHPLDITRHYYETTGYPRLPAPWALGPLIWRDENREQAEVLGDIRTIRELDLATTGIWIDRPYASAVNTFDFEPAAFPDPQAMIDAAHDAGLRLALWHTPYLAGDAQPLLDEARAAGYFPPRTGVLLNGWGEPIDLTNADAYTWWQDLIRRYTAMGVEGFKLDYGEDVVVGVAGGRSGWRFADGSDEGTMHHGYTLLYHQVYAETLPAAGGFLLARTGRFGDQVNGPIIWPGDLDADLSEQREAVTDPDSGDTYNAVGGLPASVIMGLGLGPSGFPFFGADTGGYRHSPPDKETFMRWMEQTALSPVMQVGDSSSQPPWVFTPANGRDQEALDSYREYARLHLRLFPYLWSLARDIARSGRPIARPLGLAFPELGEHPDHDYLLGADLLVAPVVRAGQRTRTLRLPPGTWVHWWSGVRYPGDRTITVEAPLTELPLFLRAGGMIPLLRPTIDTLSPVARPEQVDSFATSPGVLFVRLAPGSTGLLEVYDGTRLEQAFEAGELRIEAIPGEVFTEGMRLEILTAGPPARLLVDGAELSPAAALADLDGRGGWIFDIAWGGTLHVALDAGPHIIRAEAIEVTAEAVLD